MTIWMERTERSEGRKLSETQRRNCRLVVHKVSLETGVSYEDFVAPSRLCLRTASSRQAAMYLCHVLLGLTMTQVGAFFGRDRTTVAYACRQIEDLREDGGDYDSWLQELEMQIDSARRVPCSLETLTGEGAHVRC
ncbi:helix-turn-helix domain-containing protein [Pelagibacterium sp.]|uniref:helix-turn-helix domain-containing protein n=1 Tax=Pelagibacterium sp. TaxID=1967288 RepID=UPI003A8D94FE